MAGSVVICPSRSLIGSFRLDHVDRGMVERHRRDHQRLGLVILSRQECVLDVRQEG
jgi:hypothetical protein